MQGDPPVYEIVVAGHIDARRAEWFAGLTMTPLSTGETRLVGPLADQAALYGLLSRLRDLGIPLLSVTRVVPAENDQTLLGE